MRFGKLLSKTLLKTDATSNESALIPSCWLVTPMDRLAWPKLGFRVRMNTHLSNLFFSAVSNIERTGRTLNDEERRMLRLVLSYWCGWSATAVEHMNDPCFCYIRHRWSNIQHLEPILDDMTFVEEIRWMPRAVCCERASTLLLASPDRYYVYSVECDTLFDAGSTLKEVYEGLKGIEWVDTLHGCGWEELPPYIETNSDSISHFPDYDIFHRTLLYDIAPFIARFPIHQSSLEETEGPEL
jgi:hypothetical protein